ncbi:MAG: hypothetical protein IIC35_05515, partial [Gemmatimonadetes bacterium]|nr:hypothetical protein [Gemmatimonadota bacterium]
MIVNTAENFAGDGYHIPVTHRSARMAQAMLYGQGVVDNLAKVFDRGNSHGVSAGNGHGLSVSLHDSFEDLLASVRFQARNPQLMDYRACIQPEVERRLGP